MKAKASCAQNVNSSRSNDNDRLTSTIRTKKTKKVCGRCGRADEAAELLREMKAGGAALKTPVYSAVLNAYRRVDHWQGAVALVREIHDWKPVGPNVFNYNLAICTCADCGKWEEALELLHYMRDVGGVDPDVVTYNIVVAACGKAGEAQKAIEIFREMSEVGERARWRARWLLIRARRLPAVPDACGRV